VRRHLFREGIPLCSQVIVQGSWPKLVIILQSIGYDFNWLPLAYAWTWPWPQFGLSQWHILTWGLKFNKWDYIYLGKGHSVVLSSACGSSWPNLVIILQSTGYDFNWWPLEPGHDLDLNLASVIRRLITINPEVPPIVECLVWRKIPSRFGSGFDSLDRFSSCGHSLLKWRAWSCLCDKSSNPCTFCFWTKINCSLCSSLWRVPLD
jgi:hypothetical protein